MISTGVCDDSASARCVYVVRVQGVCVWCACVVCVCVYEASGEDTSEVWRLLEPLEREALVLCCVDDD